MEELITAFAPLGIGGVLAAVMFYFYRQDRQATEARILGITESFREIIEGNTKAMTELVVTLRNGHSERRKWTDPHYNGPERRKRA